MSIDQEADLIARLEAATGPDRELDARIWCAVFAPEGAYVERSRFNGEWCIYHGKSVRSGEPRLWEAKNSRVRPVTESLDAALTLVPVGGWRWHVDYRPGAQCWHGLSSPFNDECDSLGATPAIALCIAALKARAARAKEGT
jgi:hypothetical protein